MKRRRKILWGVVGGVLLTFLVVGVLLAATVVVDNMDDGYMNLQVGSAGDHVVTDTVAVSSGVLGGHRDAELHWISGSGTAQVLVDYDNSNKMSFAEGSSVTAWAKITWDGDSDPDTLDPDGLGGVDLYGGTPATNDGIRIVALSIDHDTAITFTAYSTDTTHYSDMRIDVPGDSSTTRMDLVFPFTSFTSQGSNGGVDWSNLGALVLEINGRIQSDLDLTLDYIEADSTREYGDLPVSLYTTSILSATHIPKGMRLGHNCDTESSYHSSTNADGDDSSEADDEDGVAPSNLPWSAGSDGGEVEITMQGCSTSVRCYVHGWIDWNGDGDFDDTVDGASEHIVNGYSRTSDATVARSFDTPTSFSDGYYYARFRICPSASTNCDTPTTLDTDVSDGEVEDYRWALGPTAITLTSITARSTSIAVGLLAVALLGLGALGAISLLRRRA